MKKIIIGLCFFTVVFILNASAIVTNDNEVILKSGEKISGKIVFVDDAIVKIKSEGIDYSIKKNDIRKINFSKNDSENDNEVVTENKTNNEDNKHNEVSDDFKANMYSNYKEMLNAGFGFLIPGLVMTFTPLIFGTAPIVYAINNLHALNYNEFMIPLSFYFGIIGTGVIFIGLSAVFFSIAGYLFNKYVKSYSISMISGCDRDKSFLALRIKL